MFVFSVPELPIQHCANVYSLSTRIRAELFPRRKSEPAEYRTVIGVTGMLWTISVILIVMWVLGMVSSYTMGGFIHILLVIAIVTMLLRLIGGRRLV